eukprot:TRINITY_DN8517_c0_g1_i1.p1 TRINITY_DN8517_c0_g1~~TRINITY_DN8517_c0_g1_i1.p1  ORF type:complete len:237 (-),score=52.31 TRINITY_DN8517_c0_g1_i1:3-614(-)
MICVQCRHLVPSVVTPAACSAASCDCAVVPAHHPDEALRTDTDPVPPHTHVSDISFFSLKTAVGGDGTLRRCLASDLAATNFAMHCSDPPTEQPTPSPITVCRPCTHALQPCPSSFGFVRRAHSLDFLSLWFPLSMKLETGEQRYVMLKSLAGNVIRVAKSLNLPHQNTAPHLHGVTVSDTLSRRSCYLRSPLINAPTPCTLR